MAVRRGREGVSISVDIFKDKYRYLLSTAREMSANDQHRRAEIAIRRLLYHISLEVLPLGPENLIGEDAQRQKVGGLWYFYAPAVKIGNFLLIDHQILRDSQEMEISKKINRGIRNILAHCQEYASCHNELQIFKDMIKQVAGKGLMNSR